MSVECGNEVSGWLAKPVEDMNPPSLSQTDSSHSLLQAASTVNMPVDEERERVKF